MIGVDLFAGAGGMSLGALSAGISVRIAVESAPHAAATYRYNHAGVQLYEQDIRGLKEINLNSGEDKTIVFGGPPCKGFSTSNQRTRTRTNPNNWLYREFLRIVKIVTPDWVVFENVKGIQETEGGEFLNAITESLQADGYTLSCGVLNAADFGVPQNRSRFFIVGSRHGKKIELPVPTARRYITVKDAFIDLPLLSNGASVCLLPYSEIRPSAYARLMRGKLQQSHNHLVTKNADYILNRYSHIPKGGNWENIPAKLMKNYANRNACHTGIYHRLHPDEPSKVIGNYRKNMVIHPYQDRGLSVREAARLQSFPDWFTFKGSIGFQQEQVGNAVPPLLARAVFEAILSQDQ
jgi:DNA (cytosine-5)-methyltransferase 1